MNKLTPIICSVFYTFFSVSSIGSEKNTILPITPATIAIPTNIHYLSMGPRFRSEKSLRVSIIVEEIYPSIFVEEINFGDVEGDPDVVAKSYFLSGFDITERLGENKRTRLNNINYIRWLQWNEFEMKHNEIKFKITYNSNSKFNIETI